MGQFDGSWVVDLLQRRGDANRGEGEPRSRAGTEAHRTELAGVLVDPRPGLSMEPSDLGGVDERFGLGGRENAQPGSKPVGEQVGEPVKRIVVVVGLLAARARWCRLHTKTSAGRG